MKPEEKKVNGNHDETVDKPKKPSLVKRIGKGAVKVGKTIAKPVVKVGAVVVPAAVTIIGMGLMLDEVNERQFRRYHPKGEQPLTDADDLKDAF